MTVGSICLPKHRGMYTYVMRVYSKICCQQRHCSTCYMVGKALHCRKCDSGEISHFLWISTFHVEMHYHRPIDQ